MSFFLDPPLLVANGAAIETVVPEDRRDLAAVAVASVFIGGSLALYANAPGTGLIWRPFGSRSGREFMITSGLAEVDESSIGRGRHAAAMAQFLLYPVWLQLGRRIARERG